MQPEVEENGQSGRVVATVSGWAEREVCVEGVPSVDSPQTIARVSQVETRSPELRNRHATYPVGMVASTSNVTRESVDVQMRLTSAKNLTVRSSFGSMSDSASTIECLFDGSRELVIRRDEPGNALLLKG